MVHMYRQLHLHKSAFNATLITLSLSCVWRATCNMSLDVTC